MPRVATLDHSRFFSRASTRHAQFLFVEHRTNMGACVASICSFLRVPMMRQCHSTNRRTSSTWPRCASTREKTPQRSPNSRSTGSGHRILCDPKSLSFAVAVDLRGSSDKSDPKVDTCPDRHGWSARAAPPAGTQRVCWIHVACPAWQYGRWGRPRGGGSRASAAWRPERADEPTG